MRETTNATIRHRVKGRPALTRRLRAVQLAVARFGQHRATSDTERRWAARTFDAIARLLAEEAP